MKIILLKQVKKLGNPGDIVNVSDGYGLNFLLPQGLARLATDKAKKSIEQTKQNAVISEEKKLQNIREGLSNLGTPITLLREAKDGKLFGSVTAREIGAIFKEKNIPINEKMIAIDKPIKEVGTHNVSITQGKDTLGTIIVSIEAK